MRDLILLHGALGSAREFEQVKELLSGLFQIHTLDFNGHGENEEESVFYIDGFSDDLRKFIEKKGLMQPFVFGYSMGGYVALYHENRYPNSFSGILTLGTKFNWTPESSVQEASILDPVIVMQKVPQYASYLETIHYDRWEENMIKTKELMLKLGSAPELNDSMLGQINIPVTIGRGTLDKMVSREESEHVAHALPNGIYVELDEVKHPIHQIDPIRIVDFIRNVLGHVL